MSTILKTFHGPQAGLDKDGYFTSPVGARLPALQIGPSNSEVAVDLLGQTTVATGSTAANLAANGTSVLGDTAGVQTTYTLDLPRAGVLKNIVSNGGSTGNKVGTATNSSINSTAFAAALFATFPARSALQLIGLSTAAWGIVGNSGTVAFTTS